MLQQLIHDIQQDLHDDFTQNQLATLAEVLTVHLNPILGKEDTAAGSISSEFLSQFIAAKRVEGCSDKSMTYYESTIRNMLTRIGKCERDITTEDLREYLNNYQQKGNCELPMKL